MALNLPIGPGKFWTDAKAAIETWAAGVEAKLAQSGTSGTVGVPVFSSQAEAQAYEAENPGRVALWFDGGTEPEPGDTPVTANVPVANDSTNTITWTPKTGVQYVIGGQVRTSPYSVGDVTATVTVTAQATPGYVLQGTSSWTFNFTGSTTSTPVTATAPTANNNADTITIPTVTGVDYRINGNIVTGIYNVGGGTTSVTVTATPQSGYYLASGGSSSWTFAFTETIFYPEALQSVFQEGGASGANGVPVDSISLDSPATAGSILVASIGLDKANDGTLAPPSGWTEVVRTTNDGAGLIVAYRVAEGGEQTFQWDGALGSTSGGGRYVLHLSEFQATAPTAVASVEASSGAVNSLANDPGPAPHDGLAVAFAVIDSAISAEGNVWSAANGPDWPSGGYTQLGHGRGGTGHGSPGHAVATKQVDAGGPTDLVVQNVTAATDDLILAVLFLGMP